MSQRPIRKAVFPVAGFGTRVLPATKSVPKELLNVVDRPLIDYVVREAREAGIEHFIFVTGRGKSAIEDYFDHAYELEHSLETRNKDGLLGELRNLLPEPGALAYVRQMQPAGLGHAVWCARHMIMDEPFAVILPDVIIDGEQGCLAQMVDAYHKVGGNIVAVDEVPHSEVYKYGIVAPDHREGRLLSMSGMVEKPRVEEAPSNLSITGRYILQPEIMDILGKTPRGAGGEIQLTDAMVELMKQQDFHALDYVGDSYDCGDKIGLLRANVALALKRGDLGPDVRAMLDKLLGV